MKQILKTSLAMAVSLALCSQASAEEAKKEEKKEWQVEAPQGEFLDANIKVQQGQRSRRFKSRPDQAHIEE